MPGFQRLPSIIQVAATLPGGARVIAAQWAVLAKAAAGLDNPEKKEAATRSMVPLLLPMLGSADDATWRDYWAWRETVPAQLGQLSYLPLDLAPSGFIDPTRLTVQPCWWASMLQSRRRAAGDAATPS